MKKYSLYLMFAALAAVLSILAACGSGDLVDLSNGSEDYLKMTDVKDNLASNGGLIQRCKVGVDLYEHPECKELYQDIPEPPPPPESSSSEVQQEQSSNSVEPPISSAGPGLSSSGTVVTPSSSTVSTPSSSSVAPPPPSSASCGNSCATIPGFTCTVNSASPVSGDEVTVSVNVTGSGEGCVTKTYVEIEARNAFTTFQCYVNYPITGSIVTAGELSGDCTNAGANFTGKWSWPTSGAVTAVKGAVTCGSGASQNTESKTCAVTIQAPPKPTKTGSIKFTNLDYTTGGSYFYIGTAPAVDNQIAITNGGESQARCGEVSTEIEGNTDAAGTVKAVAIATCRGTVNRLDSAVATVVANPTLGPCTWKDNKTVLAKGQEATPSATLSNDYGRCGKGVTFSDGFPKVLGDADVSASPITVVASANCGTYGSPSENCPVLTIKSAIYELKKDNEPIKLPNEATVIEMDLPSDWKPDGTDGGKAKFFCQVTRDGGDGSVTGTIGTGASAVSISGNDYKAVDIPTSWTKNKYSLQVDLKCGNICNCGVSW
ncbi:MAG: hypothetical protein FWC26_09485 [Fibromonadales bacterium]|nr:hypothetical protein [Fibromonadales bacterium]